MIVSGAIFLIISFKILIKFLNTSIIQCISCGGISVYFIYMAKVSKNLVSKDTGQFI